MLDVHEHAALAVTQLEVGDLQSRAPDAPVCHRELETSGSFHALGHSTHHVGAAGCGAQNPDDEQATHQQQGAKKHHEPTYETPARVSLLAFARARAGVGARWDYRT